MPEQLAVPFAQRRANEDLHEVRGDPDASFAEASAGVYETLEAGDGAIDPKLANHGLLIASAQGPASVRQHTSGEEDNLQGLGESDGGPLNSSVADLARSPTFEQQPFDSSSSSGAGEDLTPSDKSDRPPSHDEFVQSVEPVLRVGPDHLTTDAGNQADPELLFAPARPMGSSPPPDQPTSSFDGAPVDEDAQLHNEASGTVQASENHNAIKKASGDGSTSVQEAYAGKEAASAPTLSAKTISERSFELSLPMQIQGINAGDVQLRVDKDRILISLSSLIHLMKLRISPDEFVRLSSSNNANTYLSIDDLRSAGFIIWFDPSTVSLVMSTK